MLFVTEALAGASADCIGFDPDRDGTSARELVLLGPGLVGLAVRERRRRDRLLATTPPTASDR